MKTWIKRTLIATATVTLLLGGVVACGAHHHRGPWDEARITEMRGKAVERISDKLELDATQKAGLERVADALLAQRRALLGPGAAEPRAELQALIAGPAFDRTRALALLEQKTTAVQAQGPQLVLALADFYDSLNPAQQQQLREWAQRGRGGR